jgi:hypothetical protein
LPAQNIFIAAPLSREFELWSGQETAQQGEHQLITGNDQRESEREAASLTTLTASLKIEHPH